MNKKEFREILTKQRLILDGATGSVLIGEHGMPAGVCPEKWILENPEYLINLQMNYLRSGSNIVYAPTFTANRVKLAEYGLENDIEDYNRRLIGLSKEAIRRYREENPDDTSIKLIGGDVSTTGQAIAPIGKVSEEEIIDVYKEQIKYLIEFGVDFVAFETMISLQECRCGVIALKETCPDMACYVTMSFDESGRALYGTDALTALVTLQSLGADAFGVNCSTGPDKMVPIIEELVRYSEIPVVCKPNAGLPSYSKDGKCGYSMDSDTFVGIMKTMLEKGVSLLGGCCGTTPEYIGKLAETAKSFEYNPSFLNRGDKDLATTYRFLSSEIQTVKFNLDSPFMIVGERINPTGKKALQAQLREGIFDIVTEFATQQETHGAKILDVNMGMSGIDEKDMMVQAIDEILQVTNLPLSLDSSDPDVMEAALRHYPGRALVNSVSLEKVKIEKMLPLVKKYGAMMILLPLSDAGLPGSLSEKFSILEEILKEAYAIGIRPEDIIVDGLVGTVGANPNAAVETIETIKYCREKGLPTICGLSNISFGLPERSLVNAAFLSMAITSGLTMAIANPNQDLLGCTAAAVDLLRNKVGAAEEYISQVDTRKSELEESGSILSLYGGKKIALSADGSAVTAGGVPAKSSSSNGENDDVPEGLKTIYEAVLRGNRKRILDITQETVKAGFSAQDILNKALLPAINKVGEFFDKGKYFLPQLIASAETMENSISHLEPILKAEKGAAKETGTIVIATVQGDIHDIGKNLVALMLKNHGFRVIDLGKDVPREKIVETAIQENADIIALSALMTTTMKEMAEVVKYRNERGCRAKIMIGGAVITAEYAEEIGADGFSSDAADAAKLALRLVQK